MPPKTRKTPQGNLPTSQAELDQLIADRIATAMANFEANRTDQSGGSGGTGSQGENNRRERHTTGSEASIYLAYGIKPKIYLLCK